jgi:hypothetical protein
MDQELRNLQRLYQVDPSEENKDRYAEALIRAGDLRGLDYIDERIVREYLAKNTPLPTPAGDNFPEDYNGYILVEIDETEYWSLDVILAARYVGSVYLVDLTQRYHIAEFTPSYVAHPLYSASLAEPETPIRDIIDEDWSRNAEVQYFRMEVLRHAVNWRKLDDIELDPDEEPIQQLIEYCQGNHLL